MVVTVGSDNAERPLGTDGLDQAHPRTATTASQLEGRQVSANDLLLASRLGDGTLQANLPLSASVRGEIGPDGMPRCSDRPHRRRCRLRQRCRASADGRIDIDRAEFKFNWDAANRVLAVPFQILSGGNRITLLGQVEAPTGAWRHLGVQDRRRHGCAERSPIRKATPLILNRIAVSGRYRCGQAALHDRRRRYRQYGCAASPCPAMPTIPAAICA